MSPFTLSDSKQIRFLKMSYLTIYIEGDKSLLLSDFNCLACREKCQRYVLSTV